MTTTPQADGEAMLEMKDSCQQCGRALGHEDLALICSYECT